MEAYVIEWLNLALRWLHLITGIAWIGASFYFVWLDNHLLEPRQSDDVARGVAGEVWSVHGGGFYHAQKYRVAPTVLPQPLHWFKWEAYWTWLSGIALLALMYWYGAEIYLIDPAVAALGKPLAVGIGMATLVAGWLIYDRLCKSVLGGDDTKLGLAVLAFTALCAWALCQVFSGRGAYIHYGAMLGTIMVANVFFVIIPGQRELVAAKTQGRDPDPRPGLEGKQRSVHNTYFTLPVLFTMMSNHYATTYGHRYNWLVLIVLSVAGALIRLYFVQRHKGRSSLLPIAVAATMIAGVVVAVSPRATPRPSAAQGATSSFARVQSIIAERCVACHAAIPTQPGFAAAPKGVALETPAQIAALAAQIHQQTVVTRVMPVGNLTGMTDEERAALGAWFRAGAEIPGATPTGVLSE